MLAERSLRFGDNVRLSGFKGINNKASPAMMPDGYLREVVNMHIDNSGLISQRGGTYQDDDAIWTAIWSDNISCFGIRNGNLVEVVENGNSYAFNTLVSNIGYDSCDFVQCDGHYYYVTRTACGIITPSGVKSFGQALVNVQPTLSSGSGSLVAATYQVAVTTLDANGIESGTKEPAQITVAANSSIILSNILVSTDPRVTHIAIYLSAPDGKELYRNTIIANGITTYTISNLQDVNKYPLSTFGVYSAPYGQIIAYHYSHLYIAQDNYLFYCEKLRYEQWRPSKNFQYPSRITAVLPCESGIWVSTRNHGLHWINGTTPKHGVEAQGNMEQIKKHVACLKEGSAKRIEAEFIGNGHSSYGYMATAKEGLFLLLDGGQYANVSQDILNMPDFDDARALIVNDTDSFKYVVILSGLNVFDGLIENPILNGDTITVYEKGTPVFTDVDIVNNTNTVTIQPVYIQSENNFEMTAANEIGEFKVVITDGLGGCIECDATNMLHVNRVIGLTKKSWSTGETAKIYYAGMLTNTAWNWNVAAGSVFAGANGDLTQDLTGLVFQNRVGVAITATMIKIDIEQPIQIGQP